MNKETTEKSFATTLGVRPPARSSRPEATRQYCMQPSERTLAEMLEFELARPPFLPSSCHANVPFHSPSDSSSLLI